MDHRIAWVHGIGRHTRGYSDPWRTQFDRFLQQPASAYLEVLWDNVFHPEDAATREALSGGGGRKRPRSARSVRAATTAAAAVALSPREELAAAAVQAELVTVLGARRAAALAAAESVQETVAPPRRGKTRDATAPAGGATHEWSELYLDPGAPRPRAAGARGLLSWLINPEEYLGDFARYLVSRGVRTAVREELKRLLRPLAGRSLGINVIAHSWGTVVAYDSLLDLSAELPDLQVDNLFTLGSPLWMVRHFLEDGSGRKPANLANFVNVHARGDVVGSWLKPAFQVDKDFQVPSIGPDAHGSYFVEGNEAVQHNIVAVDVLRDA
jgi:hypothetical protein